MPIRGENVGSAYIRIFGDGSSMPQDIRDAMDSSEPSVREGARAHGRTYSDEFDDEVRKGFDHHFNTTERDMFDGLNKALTTSLARLHIADETFDSPGWREFRTRLGDEFGAAGDLAGQRLEEEFRDSADMNRLTAQVRNVGPAVRRAQADLLRDLENQNRAAEAERLRTQREMLDQAYRMNAEYERRNRDLQNLGRMQDRANRMNIERDLTRYMDLLQRVERGERGTGSNRRQLVTDFDNLRRSANRAGVPLSDLGHDLEDMDDRLLRLHPRLTRFNRTLDDSASRVGRLFGRGSRNNFVNFFGGLTEGAVRAALLVPRAIGTIGAVASDMASGFRTARTAGDGLFASLISGGRAGAASLAGLIETGPAGLIALAAAAAAAVIAIGPLVSLVMVLGGGIVALAGSAFFALASGITAVVGIVLPLAAAVGGAVAVFTNLNKAQKDLLSDAVRPLKKELVGLQRTMQGIVFDRLDNQLARLEPVVSRLEPLARGIGRGVSNMIGELVSSLESPAFGTFTDALASFLPDAMAKFGRIAGNTFEGIAGIITSSLPEVRRFLDWLTGVTDEFSKWANSPEGRDDVLEFLGNARESAKEWGDMLSAVVDLFASLFTLGGKDAGDDLVGSLADNIRDLTDYINENPDAIREWFGDARDVIGDIGDIIVVIGDLMEAIDTPTNRAILSAFLGQMELFFGGIELAARASEEVVSGVFRLFRKLGDIHIDLPDFSKIGGGGAGPAAGIIQSFTGLAPRILRAIGNINISKIVNLPGVPFLTGPFAGLAAKALNRAGKFRLASIVADLASIAGNIVGRFAGLANRSLARAGRFSLADMIRDLASIAGTVVGKFSGLAGRVFNAIGKVNLFNIFNFPDLGSIAGRFSGLAGSILNQIGHIDLGSLMHGSLDPPGPLGPWSWRSGGIADHDMVRRIGEAGREAVVPLDRPLYDVDPSVRMLSAFAQGLPMASGGIVPSPGKTINVVQNITTPTTDPFAVAVEAIDRLAAVGY